MTTLTQPIAKLYKRCSRNHHDTCPGSFETWSICSCDCHAGVSDTRAAPIHSDSHPFTPISCADKAEAVSEAIAIVTPHVTTVTPRVTTPKTKGSRNIAGGHRVSSGHYKCYGHSAWADAEHPSGGEGTGPINTRILCQRDQPSPTGAARHAGPTQGKGVAHA